MHRLAKQVGQQLGELEAIDGRTDGKEVIVPETAVVSCDGGRIRKRKPGQGCRAVVIGFYALGVISVQYD